jgi:hypothetical protein
MNKLSEKLLEARRKQMLYGVAEYAEWLGFKSGSTQGLITQYRQFCNAIEGRARYGAGKQARRRVIKKLEAK